MSLCLELSRGAALQATTLKAFVRGPGVTEFPTCRTLCPGRVIRQILDMRKFTVFKKRFHGGREIRTHDQRSMVCRRRRL